MNSKLSRLVHQPFNVATHGVKGLNAKKHSLYSFSLTRDETPQNQNPKITHRLKFVNLIPFATSEVRLSFILKRYQLNVNAN